MRLHVPAFAILAAAAAVLAGVFAARDAASAPKRGHPVVLWTFDDDAERPGFAESVKALGADAVQAGPHRELGPLRKAGLGWYEDNAAVKGTLWLDEKLWKPAWDAFSAASAEPWPGEAARKRPICLRDPEVVKRLEENVAKAATRARGGAFAISLDDEPSAAVRANPVDWCLCDRCADAFRAGVKARWKGNLTALNADWDTSYASWDALRPWTTAAVKARIKERGLPGASDDANVGGWLATREFQDAAFADLLGHLRDVAAKAAPGVPCGITGLQAPSAFGGWDYAKLRGAMDFAEPYDIGLALPICRDLMPAGSVLAQTVFPSTDDGGLVSRWRLWRGVARGANATILWSSHDALTREGKCDLTPWGRAIADDLALLAGENGIGARLARATPFESSVFILLSQRSIDVQWLLDSDEDGATWPRRFGSYEASHSRAIRSREALWHDAYGTGARFVDIADLAAGDAKTRFAHATLLAPRITCLSAAERAALRALLKGQAGARLIAVGDVGDCDEFGRKTKPLQADRLPIDFHEGVFAPQRVVDATILWRNDGIAPKPELGLRQDGDALYVIAVPDWNVGTDDAGGASGKIPAGELTWMFEFPDGKPRDVTDERLGRPVGRVAKWTATSDAAGGLVFRVR